MAKASDSTLPKVSIIVPVYKVEQYLRRCLDSIASQTFTDWECILIDDGSPDKSGAICDEYAGRDSRFRVIHQENKGVSAARNAGLDAALGEWIGFVDSDDWCEKEMYEHLYNDAEKIKADCIICAFFGQKTPRQKKICRTEDALKLLFSKKGFGGFCFLRLIAAKIVENNRFDEKISYMEDVKFFYEIFKNCCLVYWNTEPLYHYERRVDSVTNQFGFTEQSKTAIEFLENIYTSESSKTIKRCIYANLQIFILTLLLSYIISDKTSDPNFIKYKSRISERAYFIYSSPYISIKYKIISLVIVNPFLQQIYKIIKNKAQEVRK